MGKLDTTVVRAFRYMNEHSRDRTYTQPEPLVRMQHGVRDVRYFVPKVVGYDGELDIDELTQAQFDKQFSLTMKGWDK